MSDVKYFWVYLPGINEQGMVVVADDLEDACIVGCNALCPDDGVEVQVHALGESQSFTAGEVE